MNGYAKAVLDVREMQGAVVEALLTVAETQDTSGQTWEQQKIVINASVKRERIAVQRYAAEENVLNVMAYVAMVIVVQVNVVMECVVHHHFLAVRLKNVV